jgi:hypothetical protein
MLNMSIWRYSTFSKTFEVITTIKDFTKPYGYKFTATVNKQYIFRTSAYVDGVEVVSDTINLKFAELTALPTLEGNSNEYFQLFPNPATNQIKLVALQDIHEKLSIKIYDIKGQQLGTIPAPDRIGTNDELIWETNNGGSKNNISGIVVISIEGQSFRKNLKVLLNE